MGFGQFNSGAYAQIDNLSNPLADAGGGIAAVQWGGTFTFEMTGTAATYAGRTLRVGVMADILSAPEWAADINKTFQLTGMSGDSGVISLRGGGAANGQPELYFIDITGVNAGDVFTITANQIPAGGQPGYIGPVTWDLYTPVPEPTAALLSALGALVLMRRRRA